MHTANLCGPEQTQIGNHAAVGRGFAAIGLSRGGAAKTYAYRDPNEDSCGFASSPAGMLLAVADGHWGYEGSQAAVRRLIESHAASLLATGDSGPPQSWEATARTLLVDLQQQILRAGGHRGAQPPRTTLSLAVAFPERALMNWLCVGDSLLFAVEERGVHEIGAPAGAIHYLGSPAD
ncbi:MAG: protein phosphatase 2C domain-containing protein, partial [Myxococcota bacterium]